MRLSTAFSFAALGAAAVSALPNQQIALDWVAGTLSQIGDDSPHTATVWSWYDCGSPEDVIQIKSITLKPDPPQPGKNLTIYATGTTKSLISDGTYADVTVKLGLIKLLTKRFDVCEELAGANATLQCPIVPDEYAIVQEVELPAEIPRAKFIIDAQVFTQDDEPAACLNLMINFLLPDPAVTALATEVDEWAGLDEEQE